MRKFLLLVLAISAFSCSKESDEAPAWNDNLIGKKFRAKAWYNNDGYGQVYDVFEFISDKEVINDQRLSNENVVNVDYRATFEWSKAADGTKSGIVVKYFNHFTENKSDAKPMKGTVTTGLLSFSDKPGEKVYEEY